MKLPRPYIPLSVRVQVAERQCAERGILPVSSADPNGAWLGWLLDRLFGKQKVELHHRPALCNREIWATNIREGDGHPHYRYNPDANDPDYLVYLPADEHDIETRVRGQHGQHSDLALARKRKRKAKKATQRKRKWPSRPLRSANRT